MESTYERVAQIISLSPNNERYGLFLYSDHEDPKTSFLYAESDQPSEIAKAMRGFPLQGGGTIPEALCCALNTVQQELALRSVKGAKISIFTDAVSHPKSGCPHAYDYKKIIQDLLAKGNLINVIWCNSAINYSWLPAGVNTSQLK
jgi:hypothetical protein